MFNIEAFIKKIIRNIRGRDTVAGVLSQFTKTIDELRELEDLAIRKGWAIEEQMNKLRDEQNAADVEADKAGRLAERLENLFD